MTTKSEKDRAKQIQDKCQTLLDEMLRDEDNKYCVDCDTKGPRWASWNLGVFLCIRCAGIHRKLGVHISRVKSVNLDTWTPEQVVSLQQMGNSRARAVYEANLPDNFRRPQNDTALETFVRAKYEQKKYIAREWVPPTIPKVNWEKEIDEEIERQKRQRKQTSTVNSDKNKSTSGKQNENFTIPQIPKPKSSSGSTSSKSNSPKPNRSSTENTQNSGSDTKNVDLLGLDQNQQNGAQGEDAFSNFLSASSSEKPEESTENSKVQNEEESFFNQPAPTEKEKAKLTKDSILALYGNTPPQSASTMYQNQMSNFSTIPNQVTNFPTVQNQPVNFQGQVTQMPTTGYQVQGMQMPVSGYQLPMTSFSSAQQGYQGIQGTVIAPQQQFPVTQNYSLPPSYGTQVTNPSIFATPNLQSQNGTNFSPHFNYFQPNSNVSPFQSTGNQFLGNQYPQNFQQNITNKQFGVQNVPNQFPNYGLPSQNGFMPNSFFGQQPTINVQQEFANMSLKNNAPKNNVVPPTAATANTWQ